MNYKIGEVAKQLGMSIDTLRYYEKEGLLPRIQRSASGTRFFTDKDISRLRFIQRSQRMGFTLKEIAELLSLRQDPVSACDDTRKLAQNKLEEIQCRMQELEQLSRELQLLINMCNGSDENCPIIEGLDNN